MIDPYGQPAGFSPTARALHWLIAALVVLMIPAGFFMTFGPDGAAKDTVYDLHRSTGIVVMVLMIVRLVYRLGHPAPPLPADLPPIQKLAAHTSHAALYVLLIVQPIVGWIATSAYPARVNFYWLFELPAIWRQDDAFSERMFTIHRWIGIVIALLICVHVGAALYHHFIRRDSVLLSMVRG